MKTRKISETKERDDDELALAVPEGGHAGETEAWRERLAEEYETAYAAGHAEAVLAERRRCEEIICCAAAEGREAFARKLALSSRMSSEDAIALLAALPKVEGGGYLVSIPASWDLFIEKFMAAKAPSRAS
jgi:hypothetical protein